MSREPVCAATDLNTLDPGELIEGYQDGRRGEPEPGGNRSRAYWHGWRVGMMDSGRMAIDTAQRQLVRDVAPRGVLNVADDRRRDFAMTPSTAQLISDLESASEGTSALDWRVYLIATKSGQFWAAQPAEALCLPWPEWIANHPIKISARHDPMAYTRSLDAALTIVIEGMTWKLSSGAVPPTQYRAEVDFGDGFWAATPALALTIAALKARQL